MATRKHIHYYRTGHPILIFALLFVIIGVVNNHVSAQTVTATFEAENKPTRIAVNPETNLIYLVNREADNVSVVDGLTNQVVANVKVGGKPNGIAVNPVTNLIYVGDSNGEISVIDGQTNRVIATIESVLSGITDPSIPTPRPLPRKLDSSPKPPDFIAVNPETNLIYVGNSDTLFIGIIDGTANVVIDSVTLLFKDSFGNHQPVRPTGIGVNPETNFIYTQGNFGVTRFFSIDGSSNQITDVVGFDGKPADLVVNDKTNRIYAAQATINLAGVINGLTNQVSATIGKANAFSMTTRKIGVNTSTNHVYVSDPDNSKLYVINGFTNETVKVLMEGTSPSDIAVNPRSNFVYVLDSNSSFVTVIEDKETASTIPSKTLRADFIADKTNNAAPLQVQFTDLSAGKVENWLWEFGDGGTSSDQNPMYIYKNSDTFSVKLTVSNSSEIDTKEKVWLINVLPPHLPPTEFPEETPGPTPTTPTTPETPEPEPTPIPEPPFTPIPSPDTTGVSIDFNPRALSPSLLPRDITVSVLDQNSDPVSGIPVKLKGIGFGAVVKTSSEVTNSNGIATVSGRFRFVSSGDATFALTLTFADGGGVAGVTIPKKTN